jgi:hypothetical protein
LNCFSNTTSRELLAFTPCQLEVHWITSFHNTNFLPAQNVGDESRLSTSSVICRSKFFIGHSSRWWKNLNWASFRCAPFFHDHRFILWTSIRLCRIVHRYWHATVTVVIL